MFVPSSVFGWAVPRCKVKVNKMPPANLDASRIPAPIARGGGGLLLLRHITYLAGILRIPYRSVPDQPRIDFLLSSVKFVTPHKQHCNQDRVVQVCRTIKTERSSLILNFVCLDNRIGLDWIEPSRLLLCLLLSGWACVGDFEWAFERITLAEPSHPHTRYITLVGTQSSDPKDRCLV